MMEDSKDHPLNPNNSSSISRSSSNSMESLLLDPLADHHTPDPDSNYTLIAAPVNSHPLGNHKHNSEEEEDDDEPTQTHEQNMNMPHELKLTEEEDEEEEEEDVDVFTSATRINSTAGHNRLIHQASDSSSCSSEFLNIIVTQPQKEVDPSSSLIPGGTYFVTYLVSARTNMHEFGRTECSVRRRFKDIVALADSLVDKYRGYFVPSRPDKSIVESQIMDKHDFVEQRRVGIERYLRRLAGHPVLRKSEELRVFLLAKGKLPLVPTLDVASRMLDGAAKLPRQLFGAAEVVVNPEEVVHSAKGGRDLLRLFKELRQSVTNDWGAGKPAVVEEDKEFVEKKEQLREYERRLSHVTQQAHVFLKAQEHLASVTGDHLGLSLFRLAKLETQSASSNTQRQHAADVKRMANAIVKTSRLQRAANTQAVRHLDHLYEHLAVLQSAHTAFSERDNALLTVQTLLSDISTMHARAEKHSAAASRVFGGDRSRNKKVEDLKDSIKVTEEACGCAQQKYNQIKDHNRMEIDRIEAEKQSRFLQMLHGFVHSQIACAEKISREWSRVVDESAEYSGRRLDSPSPVFRSSQSFHG